MLCRLFQHGIYSAVQHAVQHDIIIKALWQPMQTEQEPIQPAHGQQALISSCTRLCWPGWDRKCDAKEAGQNRVEPVDTLHAQV